MRIRRSCNLEEGNAARKRRRLKQAILCLCNFRRSSSAPVFGRLNYPALAANLRQKEPSVGFREDVPFFKSPDLLLGRVEAFPLALGRGFGRIRPDRVSGGWMLGSQTNCLERGRVIQREGPRRARTATGDRIPPRSGAVKAN